MVEDRSDEGALYRANSAGGMVRVESEGVERVYPINEVERGATRMCRVYCPIKESCVANLIYFLEAGE